MKNKLFRNILLAIFMTAVSAACLPTQETEDTTVQPLRVGFTGKWGDYTLLVAKENNIFEKYGVEVDPVYYKVYSEYAVAMASGQLDGAFLAIGDIININPITPLKIVGLNDDGGANAILAGPDINEIGDLKGKRVGVLIGAQYEMMVADMLQSAGMNSGDIRIVFTNPEEALAALQTGRVQAVHAWEPYISQAIANGYKVIYPPQKTLLFPDAIVFRDSVIKQRPNDIRAFLAAWYEAVSYRLQHEGETRQIAAEYVGGTADNIKPDINLRIYPLQEAKVLFSIQEKNSIYDMTRMTSDYLVSIGSITQDIDLLALIDPSYLP